MCNEIKRYFTQVEDYLSIALKGTTSNKLSEQQRLQDFFLLWTSDTTTLIWIHKLDDSRRCYVITSLQYIPGFPGRKHKTEISWCYFFHNCAIMWKWIKLLVFSDRAVLWTSVLAAETISIRVKYRFKKPEWNKMHIKVYEMYKKNEKNNIYVAWGRSLLSVCESKMWINIWQQK